MPAIPPPKPVKIPDDAVLVPYDAKLPGGADRVLIPYAKYVELWNRAYPDKPKDAKCPRCAQPMRTLFTRRQKWAYRCDPCQAWYDA